MNNIRNQIQIAFFAISLFVFLNSNAQQISYEYDNSNFGEGSVGVRGNGGRTASVTSTLYKSTVNRNNNYENSAQLNQGRPTNQLSTGTSGVYQSSNKETFNREYVTSRPSQPLDEDLSSNDYSNGYHNNIEQSNQKRPNQQAQGGSIYSSANNALPRPSQVLEQNTWTNGASNSNRPILPSNDRNSVYNNNKNNNGISDFQNTGQGNQRRPVLQDSSESLYPSTSNSYQSQQTLDRNKNYNINHNSDSHFQSNGNGPSNQGRPTNNQFNPSNNGYDTSTSQRATTRSPQFLERDTVNNNNGFGNDNYHQSGDQWNTKPPTNLGGSSTLGIIASNDGYVQSRPSQDLDRNINVDTNIGIKNNNYEANSLSNNKHHQSGQSGSPINRLEGSNHQNNGNQFFNSENYENSHESKPVPTSNRQNNNNNGNNANNKNKNNSNVNKHKNLNGNINSNGNGNRNRHSNGNGNNMNNNGNQSGEKHSNSKSNNSHSQTTSVGHQANKTVKKPNIIGLINSNKNKNSNSNKNEREKKTSGGNTKKRVSQIKYEQYLTSIFPDLDNEDVQEIKDFQGRKLARPGQFPHMGAIGFKNHILNKTEYKCGASLISDIWAITTAHCTKYNDLKPTYVRFGDLNLKAAEEDIDPQTRKISMIVNHPSYNENSLYNDIALLQLNKVVIFTEFVQPIRIWYLDDIPFTMAYAMGFGAVQFAGAQTYRLTQLELTIIPNDVCARQMPKQSNAKQGIISSQICAIDNKQTESDTFQGDSGGPLEISFYVEEGRRQRQYLIGLTSFGVVGSTRLPGVYTRVSSYVDWIEKTVWSSEYDALQ